MAKGPSAKGLTGKILKDDIGQVSTGCNRLFMKNFGIWSLSVQEAAELIASDAWFYGYFDEVEEPDNFSGDPRNPLLMKALEEVISTFADRLTSAIDSEKLNADKIVRDFDEKIDRKNTFVEFSDLANWLFDRGYEYGDVLSEWEEARHRIAEQTCYEVEYLDLLAKEGRLLRHMRWLPNHDQHVDEMKASELREELKAVKLENAALKARLAQGPVTEPKPDRQMTTRSRRTLLSIIAALAEHAGVDYQARGAAKRLMEITEYFGIPVDDDTIRVVLKDIPDAVESRSR